MGAWGTTLMTKTIIMWFMEGKESPALELCCHKFLCWQIILETFMTYYEITFDQ